MVTRMARGTGLLVIMSISVMLTNSVSAFQALNKAAPLFAPAAPSALHISRQSVSPQVRFGTFKHARTHPSSLPLRAKLPSGGNGGGAAAFLRAIRQQLANLTTRVMRAPFSGLLLPTVLLAMLASGQFGWLWSVVNTVFLLVFIVPIVGVIAVNLWVKMSLVNGNCPSCSAKVMLPKNGQGQSVCFSCGTPLLVEDGKIARAGMYNTQNDVKTGRPMGVDIVDVEAIDVDSREAK
mmetsp:Transcript_21765/g.51680  ORF Transcript_21765/g.51680 Transcript_21765/m.51680 type:complete len:236 (-) Transcript_21765:163-870(-)